MPVRMSRPQCVVIRDRVYVGGGRTDTHDDRYLVSQYNPARDEWIILPPCPVRYFGLCQFSGELITVGGRKSGGIVTGQVYHFIEASQQWEEYLRPMPTARFSPIVITTQSAIIACGGIISVTNDKPVPCATVEVHINNTSQWHTTDPLPVASFLMSSVTIANICYLLGGGDADQTGINAVMYAPVTSLIQKAMSPPQQSASRSHPDSGTSIWKTLPDILLNRSAAATLSGSLLAVGGHNQSQLSAAVHVFIPRTNSWVRVRGRDLPEPRYGCTAIQLPSNKLLVIGGYDNSNKYTNTVFLGSVVY